MAATKGRQPNPKLEKLRDTVPEPPNINVILEDMITTSKIHFAYLYYTEKGGLLLQQLCLLLSGTKPTHHYADWEELGIKLDLNPFLIKCMKYSLKNEDPTWYVFLAYAQKDDATIQHLLVTLREIKRHDVLLQVRDLVKETCKEILTHYTANNEEDIIKQVEAPNCPFILKNLNKHTKPRHLPETLQRSSPFVHEVKRSQNRYAKTILLTYSGDADEIVKKLVVRLRKPKHGLRLGVVLLNEQRSQLHPSPEDFIVECFGQVNCVFPVITMQYIKEITNKSMNISTSALDNPDHKYVRFMYRLMSNHFLRTGCKNTMVRCIIPDDIAANVLKHPIMNHSLFQIWVRASEINALIDAILKANI